MCSVESNVSNPSPFESIWYEKQYALIITPFRLMPPNVVNCMNQIDKIYNLRTNREKNNCCVPKIKDSLQNHRTFSNGRQ